MQVISSTSLPPIQLQQVVKKIGRPKKADSKSPVTARRSKVTQPRSPKKSPPTGVRKRSVVKHAAPKPQKKSRGVGGKGPSVSLQLEPKGNEGHMRTSPAEAGPISLVRESQATSLQTPGECAVSLVNNGKESYEEDAAWTCSSDDDFAVSLRLEELQRRSLREASLVAAEMDPLAVGQGVEVPMVCLSPELAGFSPLAMKHSAQHQEADRLGGCGHQPQGSALEIDPSGLEMESRALVYASSTPVTEKSQVRKKTATSGCRGGKLGKAQKSRVRTVGSGGQVSRTLKGKERDLGGRSRKKKGSDEKVGKMKAREKPRKKEEEPNRARSKKRKEKEEVKRARGRPRKEKGEESKKARERPRKEKKEEKKAHGKPRKEEGKKRKKAEHAKPMKKETANKPKRLRKEKVELPKRPRGRPKKVVKEVTGHPQLLLNSPQNGEGDPMALCTCTCIHVCVLCVCVCL